MPCLWPRSIPPDKISTRCSADAAWVSGTLTGGGSTKSPLGNGKRTNTVKLVSFGSVLAAMADVVAGTLRSGVNPQLAE